MTPLYYPDEYIYTALARSIAATGIPSIRGSAWHFPSFLAPYLMAPAWWIGNVRLAYHLVLALGAIAFSAAVFPAYVLARRLGTSARGAVIVGLFAVLVPDGAFASAALTEPYAYPVFLTVFVFAVDALAFPTRTRQAAALALMGVLCLFRIQFGVLPVVYLGSAVVLRRGSIRQALRAQGIVAVGFFASLALVLVVGVGRIAGFYSNYASADFSVAALAEWFGFSVFVLLIAAGWAVIPGALVGLKSLWQSADQRGRAFAVFAVGIVVALLLVATYPASVHDRVYERYVFYSAPLLAVAFISAFERGLLSEAHRLFAYALAAAAILVPATASLHSSDTDQAPALLGLHALGGGGAAASLIWAGGLALAAVIVAQVRSRQAVSVVLATAIMAAISIAATHELLGFVPAEVGAAGQSPIAPLQIHAPKNSALVTWTGTDRFTLMKTLFWSPNVKRVLVVDGGEASDGFGSTPVMLRDSSGVVGHDGRSVPGPFALGLDTTAAGSIPPARWLPRWPSAIILGLDRDDHALLTVAQLLAEPGRKPLSVFLQLHAASPRRLTIDCGSRRVDLALGAAPRSIDIKFAPGHVGRCRISLTKGAAVEHRGRITSGVRVLRFSVERPGA